MNEGLRKAMRGGIRDGFDRLRDEQIMKPARDGSLPEWALKKEQKKVRQMKMIYGVVWIMGIASWALALYLFWTGNVGGGFGALAGMALWAFLSAAGGGAAKAVEEKHYIASALDWSRKELDK